MAKLSRRLFNKSAPRGGHFWRRGDFCTIFDEGRFCSGLWHELTTKNEAKLRPKTSELSADGSANFEGDFWSTVT